MTTRDCQPRVPALFLMGPTASGKTDLALELVERYPLEIVSVDSALVYRHMDIGTAKPSPETLARAPHRLIDILDPAESYTAARFRQDALSAMADISARGKIPLLVGGTLLYFRALEQGLATIPEVPAAVRDQLERQAQSVGLSALHERLAQVDPVAARRIHAHDSQRIKRALEVFEGTGRPLSNYWQQATGEPLPYRAVKFIVAPQNRRLLHDRIAERFQHMLERGFVSEVEGLRGRGDLSMSNASMRAVGYRQIWQHLDGETDFEEMRRRVNAATRQLAKRQLTWLRAETGATWIGSNCARIPASLLACMEQLTEA